MAELLTIARPYARAAFMYAKEQHVLAQWLVWLRAFQALVLNLNVKAYLEDPNHTKDELIAFLMQMLGEQTNAAQQNFIRILVAAKKLKLMPMIHELFYKFYQQFEKTLDVKVTTFMPLDASQQEKLTTILTQKLDRKVKIESFEDASLLGGLVVQADDMLIDGSVRGRLQQIAAALEN